MTGVAPQYWLDWPDDRLIVTAENVLNEMHKRK